MIIWLGLLVVRLFALTARAAWTDPSNPVSATVITVAYAVANFLTQIRWLRTLTGGADPPGSGYVVVSDSTTATSWAKVPADALASNAVTTAKITDGSVTAVKMAVGAVLTATILDGQVTTAKIADGAITAAKMAVGAVLTATILDGQVTTAKIADGAITAAKMAVNSILTANIQDGQITAAKMAVGAILTANILDAQVTTAKIADGAVTAAKLGTNSILTATINNAAVTIAKIADATDTPTAGKIPIADGSGLLDAWVSASAGVMPAGMGALWSGVVASIPAGWTRWTDLNGRLPVGAGSTFSLTFVEGASYGSSWAHQHTSNSWGVSVSGAATGGPEDVTGNNSASGQSAGTGTNRADSPHNHSLNGVSFAVSASGSATGDTTNTTWLPPMLSVVYVLKS